MIEILYTAGKILINRSLFTLGQIAIADDFTIDAELYQRENLWLTSFNINSVTVNGQSFQSSQELLKFFQQ